MRPGRARVVRESVRETDMAQFLQREERTVTTCYERMRAYEERNKEKLANRVRLLTDLRARLDCGEITTEEYQREFLALQKRARAGQL